MRSTQAGRPRKRFKRYNYLFSLIQTVLCVVMLFGIGISLVTKERASGFIESENRNLAEFPKFSLRSYFSGDYTDGIVTYYTDTIPAREQLRSVANRVTAHFGIRRDDLSFFGDAAVGERESLSDEEKAATSKVTVYTGTRPAVTTATETVTEPIQTKERTEIPDDGEIINSSVIVSGRGTPEVRAMPMFGGMFEIGRRYAEVLNEYKEMVGDTVNIYNMSIPLASAFYMPKNLEGWYSDQHECITNIGLSLNNVINVDVFETLSAHTDEYIFLRTDHHWQPLGAYYAAQQFAEEAAVPFTPLSEMEECVKENFCGTMYMYTGYLEELQTYPDTYYYYRPQNDYTISYYDGTFSNPQESTLFFDWAEGVNTYSTILGGDLNIAEIKTDVGNGRTLVVIKNSYGNALVPFLVGSFEKIYVVDFRYVQVGMEDFFTRVGATDVLFGMAISSCYTSEHINAIREIMRG